MHEPTGAEGFMEDFMQDVLGETIFCELAETAERCRWRLSEIPWDAIDPARVTPDLRAIVREMAFSEQTTFSATQKFLQAFSDDLDFSQWMSVWFYEETCHPLVLTRWLSVLGERFDSDFVARGRVSTPFMRSRMGTLVTNVISEVNASSTYALIAEVVDEPVLTGIARRLSADEARHASSFYRYAARRLERSSRPERERLDALKVLHFWLNESRQVTHPVNQALARIRAHRDLTPRDVPVRVCRMIGTLVDLPVEQPADADAWLNPLIAQAHAAGSCY